MIYEMVEQCIESLRGNWTSLDTGLRQLSESLPNTAQGQALRAQIDAAPSIADLIAGIVDPTPPNADFPNVAELLASARASLNTSREFLTDLETRFSVWLPGAAASDDAGVAIAAQAVEQQIERLRNLIEHSLSDIEELAAPEGARASLSGIRSSVDNISNYPVLTQNAETNGGPRPAPSDIGGGAPIGRTVEGALRQVLGWKPNPADPKGFVAALTQSFQCKEIEGRTECKWTQRTYSVQADLGAVTGAQASIYSRAKAALDESLPLLEGLRPLRSDFDKEDGDAALAIVSTKWKAVVAEFGRLGGPRVQRVDNLFQLLLGPDRFGNAEAVGGQLGRLRDTFGLNRNQVNTIQEEDALTRFLIVVDYVNSLRASWDSQRQLFSRVGGDVFFGTQTVLLARSLAVVAESVDEVQFALDSVFIGSAEQQVVELHFNGSQPIFAAPMFIADLLDWVREFAAEEAPLLIRDGGKAGTRASISTLEELSLLVRASLLTGLGGQQDPESVPAGYRTSRVQSAIEELADHLDEALDLARAIENGRPILIDGNRNRATTNRP